MDGQQQNNRYDQPVDTLNSSLEGGGYDSHSLEGLEPGTAQPGNVSVGVLSSDVPPAVARRNNTRLLQRRRGLIIALALLCLALIVAGLIYLMLVHRQNTTQQAKAVLPTTVSTTDLSKLQANGINNAQQLDVNGVLQANQGLVLTPTSTPTKPVEGQIYLDATSHQIYYYDGTRYVNLTPAQASKGVTSIAGLTGDLNLGSGLKSNGLDITNSGVLSLNGFSGGLSLANASSTDGVTLTIDNATTSSKGLASFNATNFLVNSGAINTVQDIGTGATPTFAGVNTNSITPSGSLAVGSTGQTLSLQGNGLTTLSATSGGSSTVLAFQSPTANVTFRLPALAAGTYDICTTGNPGACGGGGTSVSGSGTGGVIPLWNGSGIVTALTDSILSQSGLTVTVAGTLSATNLLGNGSGITAINGSNIASGTVADTRLSNNVTLQGNSFNGINQLVQLNPSGQLPALDASLLTSLNGTNISSGTIANARLSGSVTLQGNTFNGANQLVALDASGFLPALNGSALTNLNGTTLTSGTVANARLVNSGALTVTAGTGLSGGGSVALGGSSPALNVSYGSGANTAVQGNITLTCASGTGNLSGGGTVITLGSGGSCGNIGITATPSFDNVTLGNGTGTLGKVLLRDGSTANVATLELSGALSGAVTYNLPATTGTQTICTVETGNCAGSGTGVTTSASHTQNFVTKFSNAGATQIGNSSIYDNGSGVSIGDTSPVGLFNVGTAHQFQVSNAGAVTSVGLNSSAGLIQGSGGLSVSGGVTFSSLTSGGGQCLTTDGSGVLSLVNCLSGGSGGSGGVASLNGLSGALSINNATGSGAAITINNAKADGSTKGIATFNSTNFSDNGAGVINTIQGIATTATPTFAGLTLNASGLTAGGTITFTGSNFSTDGIITSVSGVLGSGTINLGTSGYLTGTLSVGKGGTGLASLSTNQLLYAASSSSISQLSNGSAAQCLISNGAGSAPSFQTCTGAGGVSSFNTHSGSITVNGTANEVIVTDNGAGTFTLSTPQAIASSSTPAFAGLTLTGGLQGTTANFSGASALTLGTGGAGGNNGAIVLQNSTNSNTLTLQSGASASSFSLTLPTSAGSNGQCLTTNGVAGVLSFTNCLSGAGGGSGGVTSLNGDSGTLTLNNATAPDASHITINDAKADSSTKGIATFSNGNFGDNGSGLISIKTGGVGSTEILDGSVTGTDIASSTITNSNLASGSFINITGVGTLTTGLTLSNAGSLVTQKSSDYSTTGSQNDVNLGSGSLVRLTGASAQTVTGISGGVDGRILTLINASTNAATLANNNASSAAANRISTGTGGDVSLPSGASITLIYDSGASIWRLTGGVASTGTGGVTTVGAISGTSTANGASITGTTLNLAVADATNGGVVSVVAQNFAGLKTFQGGITSGSINTTAGTNTTLGNATGTFNLVSSNINISNTGAITGASGLTFASGNFDQSASGGTFKTGTGNVTINGTTNFAANIGITTTAGTGSFDFGNATGTFKTSTGTVSLQGNTSVTGSNTFTVGTGLSSLGGGLAVTAGNTDLTTSIATKKGADFSTTGASNDVSFANSSLIRLTGASAQTITGIAGGRDGYILTIVNAGTNAATLSNNNAGSAAANRIITGYGSDMSLPAGASTILIYDSGASLWRVTGSNGGVTSVGALDGGTANATGATISATTVYLQSASNTFAGLVNTGAQNFAGEKTFYGNVTLGASAGSGTLLTNNGATVNTTLALGNFNTGGSIGSAATTVDIYTGLSIAQTTAGQALTIQPPTANTAYGRILYVSNVGTASFTFTNSNLTASLNPGVTATLIWSNANGGASWTYAGDGSSILNQNSIDQPANFRISGTGQANSHFYSPDFDVASASALSIGSTNATNITIGSATTTGTLTLGQSTATNTINIGAAAGNTATQTINIGNSATVGSTTNIVIGSTVAGSTILQSGTGSTCYNAAGLAINTQTSGLGCASTIALSVAANASNRVVARIQGAAGQSTDLLQFSSSTPTVLSNFDQFGQLTLGNVSAGSQAGKLSFADGTNDGFKVTLQAATMTVGNGTLNIPDLAGATATICTTNSDCSVGAGGTNHYLTQVPSANGANVANANNITPTANNIIGLKINGTTGTAADALLINQSGAANGIDIVQSTNPGAGNALIFANNSAGVPSGNLLDLRTGNASKFAVDVSGNVTENNSLTSASSAYALNATNASGTQTDGFLFNRNAVGGTTTNGINITNTAGTLTNGLSFSGTIGTDIGRASGTLTIQGSGVSVTSANVAGATGTVAVATGNATAAGASGLINVQTGTTTSGASGAITIQSGNATAGAAGTVTIDTGTGTGSPILNLGNTNAKTINFGNGSATTAIQGSTVGITGTTTLNSNTTVGASAGSGTLLTNNGATVNTVYNMANLAGGGWDAGGAAATVDKYTYIAVNQTTAGQALTVPSPTAGGTYGRVLYITNIGTTSFTFTNTNLNAALNKGVTAIIVWSHTNGADSWTYAGDGSSILNQNSIDQAANFRIAGTGQLTNSTAAATLNLVSSTNPTNGVLTLSSTTGTDKLINGQAGKFTVDANGNVVAVGTLHTGSAAQFQVDASGNTQTTGSLNVGGSNQFQISNSGNVTSTATEIINTGSSTAFQVNDALGTTALLTADTTSKIVTIGSATGGVLLNNGATVDGVKALTDIGADGPLTTAANINTYSAFTLNQTSGGGSRALSLPSPTTNVAATHIVYVSNIGTASFTLAGVTLSANTNGSFLWNGTAWSPTAVSTGVTLVGTFSLSSIANGASISGNTITFGPADGSNPGMVSTGIQSFAGAKTFTDTVSVGKTSTTAFSIGNTGSANIYFSVDTSTSGGVIVVGTGADNVTFKNGGAIASGNYMHVKTVTLPAEYTGAVLDAASDTTGTNCSANNAGIMTSGYDNSASRMNYYDWNSSSGTAQCYDVVVQVPVPKDFNGWASSNPLSIKLKKDATGTAAYAIQIIDSTNTTDSNYNYSSPGTLTTSWANMATSAFGNTAGTNGTTSYAPGDYFTIKIRMTSTNSANVFLGNIVLNYNSTF